MTLLKKYKTYLSNVQWHIDTNNPQGEALRRCKERKECYDEIINDLEKLQRQKLQDKIIGEDNICPETGSLCLDECCPPGSVCNVSAKRDSLPAGAAYVKGGEIDPDKIFRMITDLVGDLRKEGRVAEALTFEWFINWWDKHGSEFIMPSRPSLDIDKIVEELRVANPYEQKDEMPWETSRIEVWNKCCNKLKELLNQSK